MIIKATKVSELIESGKLRVGSYVSYVPDYAKYTSNTENTGSEEYSMFNNRMTPWVVVYVDKSSCNVDIMPCENLTESVYLNGIVGYVNGIKELNVIASKLGGNSELGITARCPTIEDMNKIFEPVFSEKVVKRYAYYPDCYVRGECEFNGNIYIKTCCNFDSEFYNCDGGGIEKRSTRRRSVLCRTSRIDQPVFVTETYYWYSMNSDILKKGSFWLASQFECLDSSLVDYGVRFAGPGYGGYVSAEILCDSCNQEYSISKGIRAIVTLDSTVRLGMCENMDGRYPRTGFSIIV